MKKTLSITCAIIALVALFIMNGCQEAENLKNDAVGSYENLKEGVTEAKENVEGAVQTVQGTYEDVKETVQNVSETAGEIKEAADNLNEALE